MTEGTNVIGYVRVSTGQQGESGAGLEAQEQAIRAECERRGWKLIGIERDVLSGKSMNGRHGLDRALRAVESGKAAALIAAKLDRVARSLKDFADLMERSRDNGWGLVALDLGVDTTTPNGEFMATVIAGIAVWERRMIGQRTKDALAVKKAEGIELRRACDPPGDTDEDAAAAEQGLLLPGGRGEAEQGRRPDCARRQAVVRADGAAGSRGERSRQEARAARG